jgi:hypothetical protein
VRFRGHRSRPFYILSGELIVFGLKRAKGKAECGNERDALGQGAEDVGGVLCFHSLIRFSGFLVFSFWRFEGGDAEGRGFIP